jgi:hypothetical protein
MQIDTSSHTTLNKPIVITDFDMQDIKESQKHLEEDISSIQCLDLFYKRNLVTAEDPNSYSSLANDFKESINPRDKVKEEAKAVIQSKFNKFTDVF